MRLGAERRFEREGDALAQLIGTREGIAEELRLNRENRVVVARAGGRCRPDRAEPAARRSHPGDHQRQQRRPGCAATHAACGGPAQRRAGGKQLDAGRHGGEARHQREGFQVVVPELRGTAEAVELDHRQREVEAEGLALQGHVAIEFPGRPGGRCRGCCS